jgi:hypothetical protein
MSCFIVSDKSLNRLASFILTAQPEGHHEPSAARRAAEAWPDWPIIDCIHKPSRSGILQLMHDLRALNIDAFRTRYQARHDQEIPAAYLYEFGPPPTPHHAIKIAQCLIYQCSEGEHLTRRPEFTGLERFSERLALTIVRQSPAYNAAPWG